MKDAASADDVVKALNDLTDSVVASERAARTPLAIGPNDAKVALRFLPPAIRRRRAGHPSHPRLDAEHRVGGTTALIDRLADAGGWNESHTRVIGARSSSARRFPPTPPPRVLSVRSASAAAAAATRPAERRIVADFLDDIARGEKQDIDDISADEEAPRAS